MPLHWVETVKCLRVAVWLKVKVHEHWLGLCVIAAGQPLIWIGVGIRGYSLWAWA